MSARPRWLPARLLGLLVLGWAGMGVLAAVMGGLVPELGSDPAAIGVIQLFGLLPALAIAPRVTGVAPRAPTVPLTPGAIASAFVAGVALQLVLVGVTAAIGDLVPVLEPSAATVARLEEATELRSYARAIAVPFALVFVAPLTEELLFRGAIQPALVERVGRVPAIGITAMLFAIFHLAPYALVYATLAGLVLGALRERTGSLLPSFALHAGFNAAPILLSEALVPIPGFNSGDPAARLPLPVLFAATFAAMAALLSFVVQTDPALPLWGKRRRSPG